GRALTSDDPFAIARAALLDHLPKDAILARYQAAGGRELASGKFASPESSAALVANAFGLFAERPEMLSLPDSVLGGHRSGRINGPTACDPRLGVRPALGAIVAASVAT